MLAIWAICFRTKEIPVAKNVWSYSSLDAVAELVEKDLWLEKRLFVA